MFPIQDLAFIEFTDSIAGGGAKSEKMDQITRVFHTNGGNRAAIREN
jgi:hypothetical protein